VTRKTDARGIVTNYSYDSLNRLIAVQSSDGTWSRFAFNESGNRISAEDAKSKTTWQYDANGRVVFQRQERVDRKTVDLVMAYEYDPAGNRTAVTYPNGNRVQYRYDALNRQSAVVLPDGSEVAQSFDAVGAPSERLFPNGIRTKWAYDTKGQVKRMDVSGSKVSRGPPSVSYDYDMNGNRVWMERSDEGRSNYSYDPLNQLIEAKFPDKDFQRFDYDPVGNRMKLEEGKGMTTYTYDPANEIQASVESHGGAVVNTAYTFDSAGNMTSEKVDKKATKYTWDANNRLIAMSLPNGQKETVTYDPFNHRLSRKGKATTYYSWDGNLCVYDSSTDFSDTVLYVPLNGEIVAQVGKSRGDGEAVSPSENEPVRFYHTDALGSALALSGKNGNVLATYSYEPYGAIRHQEGSASNTNTFVGGYGVSEGNSDISYMWNRYYSSGLGSFISRDPLRSSVYYGYAENNPALFVDPAGLQAQVMAQAWPLVPPTLAGLSAILLSPVSTPVIIIGGGAIVLGAGAIWVSENWEDINHPQQQPNVIESTHVSSNLGMQPCPIDPKEKYHYCVKFCKSLKPNNFVWAATCVIKCAPILLELL